VRFDLEIVQVHAPEDDASVGWSGHEPEVGLYSRVEADTLGSNGPFNGGLKAHLLLYGSTSLAFSDIVYTNGINQLKVI
jgi:hypothetical protein